MSQMTIEVERRPTLGKNANRRTRAAGDVPAVLYGAGKDSISVQLNRKILTESLKKGGGENTIFLLQLAGTDQSRHAMIRDLQVDPVSRKIIHVDFQRIVLTEKIRVQVPIEITGLAYGVKNEGAILDFVTRQVHVQCLPTEIPAHITYDVTELHVNQHIEAKDLQLPEGVELLEDPDRVIVACSHIRVAAEPEAAEALLETSAAEPEVIKKGKLDEDGEKAEKGDKSDKGDKGDKKR